MTLSEIYNHLLQRYDIDTAGEMVEHFSDKGTRHSYIEVYDRILQPYHPAARILEIGVMTGGSLLLWDHWFDGAEITGLDFRISFNRPQPWHDLLNESHIELCWGVDSTKPSPFAESRRFDIVIDDGSHRVNDQIDTFDQYWPHVAPGGIYIIEDIEDANSFQRLLDYLEIATLRESVQIDYHQGFRAGRADDQMIWIQRL